MIRGRSFFVVGGIFSFLFSFFFFFISILYILHIWYIIIISLVGISLCTYHISIRYSPLVLLCSLIFVDEFLGGEIFICILNMIERNEIK
jgi:hypothetical protein